MSKADCGTLMLAFRAWLDEDERNVRQLVEYVIGRAIVGHIGYIRSVIDTVDGPIRLTAEREFASEADWAPIVAAAEPEAGTVKAGLRPGLAGAGS
jgi:hypothetical protein